VIKTITVERRRDHNYDFVVQWCDDLCYGFLKQIYYYFFA